MKNSLMLFNRVRASSMFMLKSYKKFDKFALASRQFPSVFFQEKIYRMSFNFAAQNFIQIFDSAFKYLHHFTQIYLPLFFFLYLQKELLLWFVVASSEIVCMRTNSKWFCWMNWFAQKSSWKETKFYYTKIANYLVCFTSNFSTLIILSTYVKLRNKLIFLWMVWWVQIKILKS